MTLGSGNAPRIFASAYGRLLLSGGQENSEPEMATGYLVNTLNERRDYRCD